MSRTIRQPPTAEPRPHPRVGAQREPGPAGRAADEGVVEELLRRSNRLGSDPRNTNYGGGNTSAKAPALDPATGKQADLLWVKGSGGDLGTLKESGLSVLYVDRIRQMASGYRGAAHEDEMQERLTYCLFGSGGAAPSIDTAMHGLLPAAHVDHLHPDAVIALATAADGEKLVQECYGDDVVWVPWRRPGFELGLQLQSLVRERPGLHGAVLGGHGLTSWADSSREAEERAIDLIRRATEFIGARGRPEPLGDLRPGFGPLAEADRQQRAAALGPVIRGLASTDQAVIGHWVDDAAVLDFIGRDATPRLAPLGTSCPDHFLRTKVRPLLLDLPADAPVRAQIERLRELHAEYRLEYAAYYQRHATPSSPPMRGADPAIFLIPGVGMFSWGADSQAARVAGEFYVNAINVMRGAEAVSAYAPIPEGEKFRVEYWELEERKLRRRPPPRPLSGRVAVITGGASGIGRAIAQRFHDEGAVVAIADIDLGAARATAQELGPDDTSMALEVNVREEAAVRAGIDAVVARFGGIDILVNNAGLSVSKPLSETTVEDWDRQYDVMARGSFLMAKYAAEVFTAQGRGGDIVFIVSKNAVAAGPNNLAYGSAKASQAHQVRLLAAELGAHGVRVNGINPDGVVRGSGIFAGEWGAERAKVYGVPQEELGQYYAGRTLLKQEVLPEHVASAAFWLVSGELSRTTGLIVPVDSGLVAGFLR